MTNVAQALYAAHDALAEALQEHGRGSDEWIEARVTVSLAEGAYEDAYTARMGAYVGTIRRH